jgi:hypothetical protein
MMNDLTVQKREVIPEPNWVAIPGWTWQARIEGPMLPKKMETRHLFMTLRMIWNHTMPRHMNVGHKIARYELSAKYTNAYLRVAITQIGLELFTRQDMTPTWTKQLHEMARWFTRDENERTIAQQKALK